MLYVLLSLNLEKHLAGECYDFRPWKYGFFFYYSFLRCHHWIDCHGIKSQTMAKLESTELLNNLLLNFTIWSASTIYEGSHLDTSAILLKMSFIMKLSLLVVHIYKDTVGFSPPLPSNLTSSLTTGVSLSLLLSFGPTFSALWTEFLVSPLFLPSPGCRRSCQCLVMHSCCKSITWTFMIKISSVSSLKKLWELRKKEKPKPLTVSFHLSQSNSHRGSGYGSTLSRIPATDGSVWACLTVIVTSHAVSKFREELFMYRYRYIERVTGNDVLLSIISANMFDNISQRRAIYSRNRRSS